MSDDGAGLFGDDDYDPYDDAEGVAASSLSGEDLPAPQFATECIGHDEIEEKFISLINKGEFPHSLIFAGPKGVGKSTMAFRLARYLVKNGIADDDADAGGGLFGDDLPPAEVSSLDIDTEDNVYKQIAVGAHPDMLYLGNLYDDEKDAGKGINVEEARKVVPFMRMTASSGGWRVVIIDDADLMMGNAQNAILKILEEPPAKTLLILVTHRVGSLIATIKSRCRTIRFNELSRDDFRELVGRYQPLPPDDMEILYSLTRGSAGRAIHMIEEGGLESIHLVIDLFQSFPDWDWVKIHKIGNNMGMRGQERSMKIFEEIVLWLTECLVKAKATNKELPAVLQNPALEQMLAHYSLNEWIEISTDIKTHFENVDRSNLDKRQTIFGLFSLFETKKAA